MPREPKGLDAWLKATWKDFSIMIRVEAADVHGMCECVTCGRRAHWSSGHIHAGHFLAARYKNSPVKFDEGNVFPQCRNCNTDGRVAQWRPHASKKQEAVQTRFMIYVIKRKGLPEVERLELERNTGKCATGDERIDQLRAMRTEYKQRAAKAIQEKGL